MARMVTAREREIQAEKRKRTRKPLSPKTTAGKKALAGRTKKQQTAAEMGSRPVQERDTGPGGMTATGSKTRRTKRVLSKPKTTSRERASRPVTSENTNTLRVQKAKKKKK